MEHKGKRRWFFWLGGGCVYLCALLLLVWAERGNPESSIQDVADAFWYSVVTISTVGYGDLYPVTVPGKCIGLVFVVASVGLLTWLIGKMVSVLTGSMIPAVRLRFLSGREWFVFSCWNSGVEALVQDLAHRHPDAVFLFPGGEVPRLSGEIRAYACPGTMEQLVSGKRDRCSLFFLDPEDGSGYEKALKALELGFPVYCMTEYAPNSCPEGLTLVNRYDCCAREYWRHNGLNRNEKTVVLIGDGSYASHLLTRGLLVNVFGPEQQIRYHVFGDWQDYRRNHHRLGLTVAIDEEREHMDSLFFHREPWNGDGALFARADRIILCSDDYRENMEVLGKLRQHFPVRGRIDLRSSMKIPGERVFGTEEQDYQEEMVMGHQLDRAARLMHQIYLDSTGGTAPGWNQLSEFLRQSNIAAADHLLTKIRMLLEDDTVAEITAENCRIAWERYQAGREALADRYRRIEHQRWMRFHSMYNWCYAPVRNNPAREHPLMLPFDQLAVKEQEKDDYAWELLGKLAEGLA